MPPIAVCADIQTNGIGSRGTVWHNPKKALLFSFAIRLANLPRDLQLHSCALYFGWLFKNILVERGSKVWLKYPNDLYIGDKKIGGVIAQVVDDCVICGIGLNLSIHLEEFGELESHVNTKGILEEYLSKDFSCFSWKQIFSNYKVEFAHNKGYGFHHKGVLIPLDKVELLDDGTLLYGGEIIFNARTEIAN